ncbi:MAG: acyltransferase family protein [Prevotella sp.]
MCGFFSHSSLSLPIKDFLIKKSKQLLVPSIAASLLLAVIACVQKGDYLSELYGGVWFLKTLFVCYILAYISKKSIRSDIAACAISSICMLIIPYGGSLMINYYLLFFWTGYFLRKHYQRYDENIILITIISFAIFVIFIFLGKGQAVDKVYVTNYYVVTNPYNDRIYHWTYRFYGIYRYM